MSAAADQSLKPVLAPVDRRHCRRGFLLSVMFTRGVPVGMKVPGAWPGFRVRPRAENTGCLRVVTALNRLRLKVQASALRATAESRPRSLGPRLPDSQLLIRPEDVTPPPPSGAEGTF